MSTSQDDYDSLSAEEREVRDKKDRAREIAEQAGTIDRFGAFCISQLQPCLTNGRKSSENSILSSLFLKGRVEKTLSLSFKKRN
jgi:hypothetical protein